MFFSIAPNSETPATKRKAMTTAEIEKKLKPCRYCGNKNLNVFHQDYNGDIYVGDEYSIDCSCGIFTGWFNAQQLMDLWNNNPSSVCDHKMEHVRRKEVDFCTNCNKVIKIARKITDMIDYAKVSDNEKVIELIKQREELEKEINNLDDNALLNYELQKLQED